MYKKILKYILLLSVSILLLFSIFIFSVYKGAFGELKTFEELKAFENASASLVTSSDGKILGRYFLENRTNIKFEELPEHLINALIATEDARYFEHEGVDSKSLLRVLFKSVFLNNKNSGGGSTINQQLAKNMFGREDHGKLSMLINKTKEGFLAHRLEEIYSKQEILALYLNTVPFGENIYGIEAASRRFFNKAVQQLTTEESAVLIGLLKANNYYNPRLYPENATRRRNVVLSQMLKYDYLQKTAYDSLKELPLKLDYANLSSEGPANYFLVQIENEATKIINQYNNKHQTSYDLKKDGLVVKTTLNYWLQKSALNAFKSHLSKMQTKLNKQYRNKTQRKVLNSLVEKAYAKQPIKDTQKKNRLLFTWEGYKKDSVSQRDSLRNTMTLLQAGLMAMDPNTGAIKAWVGGIDFGTQPYDQIHAQRQMASTFKPILYAAALQNDYDPCTYLENESKQLKDFEAWEPQNYDKTYGGSYTMAASLAKSLNIPTVNLFLQTPFEKIADLWKKLGFSQAIENKPSSALGTGTASIYETAIAYASFANGGYKITPQKIISISTADGEVIYQNNALYQKKTDQVLSEETSGLLTQMLQKAINDGTGKSLKSVYGINVPMAGKTGTSQDYADAWFAAYTPKLVMVTRVGASNPSIRFTTGANGSGGKLALPIIGKTFKSFQNAYKAPFEGDLNAIECEDFEEKTGLGKFINDIFTSNRSSYEKEQRKAQRKNRRKEKRALKKQ